MKITILFLDRVIFLENNQGYKRQNSNFLSRIDWILITLLIVLSLISIFTISSAMTSGQYNTDFSVRQILFYMLGFISLFIVTFIPVKLFKSYIWVLYGLGILSLAVLFFAPATPLTPIINGAQSWYQLGFISIQPSEFMKVSYIMALAYVIHQHNKYKLSTDLSSDVKLLFKMFLISILPMFFILMQNDLGTVLVLIAILFGMIIVSGISLWIILPTLTIAATTGAALILGILYRPDLLQTYLGVRPYQFERIYSWLQPEMYSTEGGFQLSNSMRAIGSGGIEGKGFEQGIVYIPESHTDFIFTIIGEEFGFLGSTLVIVIFFMLMLHLVRIALTVNDSFSSYFIVGLLSLLIFHIFQNIGMTIQLVPITGLPLPFLSYGGSALWANMIAMGVVMSIYFYQYKQRK
ncbi:FtsW/RodA/SpoVE family cell cycle protein [Lacicoccus qingdaonensis]|uniref:FtsW/RodA/SpoVE family cell cycle protein n=1 Tax=Lacicoccus qingdaonensis TaxID=576118 RepID=UPI000B848473